MAKKVHSAIGHSDLRHRIHLVWTACSLLWDNQYKKIKITYYKSKVTCGNCRNTNVYKEKR